MNIDLLVSALVPEEGYRGLLYDDKTGKDLYKGCLIQGNPTIGIGWNTAGKPISLERAKIIAGWLVLDTWNELTTTLPWVYDLPEDVQIAICDMAYNLGVPGLLKFTTFLSMIKTGNFAVASDDLKSTLWAKQVGARADKIESLIRNAVHS